MQTSPAAHNRTLLYASSFLRSTAAGLIGVLVGVYLAKTGCSGSALGAILSAGFAGNALAALLATLFADRLGRRNFLLLHAIFAGIGLCAFALAEHPWLLGLSAFFGMVNGMGKDRGAALIIEQAILPDTVDASGRTAVIARYTMLADLGQAVGSLLAGLIGSAAVLFPANAGETAAHRGAIFLCAGISLIGVLLYKKLQLPSSAGSVAKGRIALSKASRSLLARISALFAVDSIAGGFLTTALISYFFFERFSASELSIGILFFAARLLNAFSHLGAAWLARRIGLVNTMVFTHIPSSIFLATAAFAPNFPIAAMLFLLREGLVEMDVPTRQSFVMAVVKPEERTLASGVTNLVRLAGWAVAPAFAGIFLTAEHAYYPLLLGAALKIAYDIMLWQAFRLVKPPEERALNG